MMAVMRGGTLFSGIGAPERAMPWIDWRWAAEIDPFAAAVHAARCPGVPNLGDVTRIDPDAVEPVDLVVFGSPCQSFSVAGKRLGLDDPRGNLALVALRLIGRIRPRWMVFENVPGLLSSDGGRDFGAFLGLLGECGYGFAYRILDAQHTGVPQRRRRVFVVGYLGDWRPPAAVLFEPESLRRDIAPCRETRERIAQPVASSPEGGSRYRNDADTADNLIAFAHQQGGNIGLHTAVDCALTLQHNQGQSVALPYFSFNNTGQGWWNDADAATTVRKGDMNGSGGAPESTLIAKGGSGRIDGESETFVTHSLRADGFDASEDGTGRGTPLIPIQYAEQFSRDKRRNGMGIGEHDGPMFTLERRKIHGIASPMSVRRLTPREAERLQGFPDNWTAIQYRGKLAADGLRYRVIGNSMAVPVVRWLGERIRLFEVVTGHSAAAACETADGAAA